MKGKKFTNKIIIMITISNMINMETKQGHYSMGYFISSPFPNIPKHRICSLTPLLHTEMPIIFILVPEYSPFMM